MDINLPGVPFSPDPPAPEAPLPDPEAPAGPSCGAAQPSYETAFSSSAQEPPARGGKKEKTLKQQFTSFGVGLVVLCFFISLLAGAGGAFAVMNFYPLVSGEKTGEPAEITEGAEHQIPEPAVPAADSTAPPATEPPATEPPATEPPAAEPSAAPVAASKTKGEIYAGAVNSIVGVRAEVQRQVQTLFGRYTTRTATSTGSGFFITSDGYVVTNYHVIEGATRVTVSTYDGSVYEASVRGSEEANDIAVLKVEGAFSPAEIGSSSSLAVGDDILVIGNPLGSLSYTFTDGVVSYLNRMITGDSGATIHMFQTNAAINEGNSGGPVYDMNGKVVGIASAKYASSNIEGLGFCIPIDDVYGMIFDIIRTGYVTGKPVLGVSVQTVTEAMAARYGIPVGCYVVAVGDGTAADSSGILTADVITALDDTPVESAEDMSAALGGLSAGAAVNVRVWREGSEMIFTLTLDEYVPGAARTDYTNVYDF